MEDGAPAPDPRPDGELSGSRTPAVHGFVCRIISVAIGSESRFSM
jgi:hypothetical protein